MEGNSYFFDMIAMILGNGKSSRLYEKLVNEEQSHGRYQIRFDSQDLPSGLYFYRLEAEGRVLSKRMLILK